MQKWDLKRYNITNIWIRFGLETYSEFLVSCLVGLRLSRVLVTPPTGPDKFTIGSTYFFTSIVFLFPLMVAIITLCLSRPYIRQEKEQREINMSDAVRKLYEKEKHSK